MTFKGTKVTALFIAAFMLGSKISCGGTKRFNGDKFHFIFLLRLYVFFYELSKLIENIYCEIIVQ